MDINSDSEDEVDEVAAVGKEQQASAAHPTHETTKPAHGECGTPGCDLADFHLGPCKTQLVIGPRQRRLTVRVQEEAESQQTGEMREAEAEAEAEEAMEVVMVVEEEEDEERADAAQAALRQVEAELLTLHSSTNKAGYRGVDFFPGGRKKPFRARGCGVLRVGKDADLGRYFATAEEAALAVARANSRVAAPFTSPSLAVASRPKAAKRAAPPPKPPRTKQAYQASAGAEPPPPAVPAASPAVAEQAAPPPIGVHPMQVTVPPPISVGSVAVAPTPIAPPVETLRQKVGRIKADLELDPALSLVNAIKAANELMEIAPAGVGLPSQVDTLLAFIGL